MTDEEELAEIDAIEALGDLKHLIDMLVDADLPHSTSYTALGEPLEIEVNGLAVFKFDGAGKLVNVVAPVKERKARARAGRRSE
jgi:hypothetical protein